MEEKSWLHGGVFEGVGGGLAVLDRSWRVLHFGYERSSPELGLMAARARADPYLLSNPDRPVAGRGREDGD